MKAAPKKISVYCVEVQGTPEGDCVVLNTDRGFLQAALISRDHTKFYRWLGRECRHDTAPRRHAMNYAYDRAGGW